VHREVWKGSSIIKVAINYCTDPNITNKGIKCIIYSVALQNEFGCILMQENKVIPIPPDSSSLMKAIILPMN